MLSDEERDEADDESGSGFTLELMMFVMDSNKLRRMDAPGCSVCAVVLGSDRVSVPVPVPVPVAVCGAFAVVVVVVPVAA